ncbi:bacillithiol system protein YtxJ [Marininema mesophilum]|uniref:Bacillithiol system protein YtxJ n=1 Tax=Marininema mesophilum TaxID=1048340 RepID=A0A1H3C9W5_9BACL|nr:bacillithiol system redox-active protein YtxJ [Marininema mesophilum]SDX50830.1 bacillithiol system protein YtxJ [Marininema mesophilum]
MQWKEISTQDEWQEMLNRSQERPLLVMKHSTRCPVSANAWKECETYITTTSHKDVDYVLVKVIESRDVSNKVAEDLNVQHKSPQTILVKNNEAVWNTSHWHITQDSLEEALTGS